MAGLGCTSLEALRELIGECFRCDLGCTRTNLVFGVGNPRAPVVFVGEAPGRQEDQKGEPFVGAAGQLLSELLAHAGLRREDVYIANVLKCRPPNNRNPESFEIEACTPFLREQIRIIDPKVLVTLGNFASKFVLKTDTGITKLRGRIHTAGKFTVLPVFHPAAAMYDRTKQEELFADFETLRGLLMPAPDEVAEDDGHVEDPRQGDEPLLENPETCVWETIEPHEEPEEPEQETLF